MSTETVTTLEAAAFAKLIHEAKLNRALFDLTAEAGLSRTCDELIMDARRVLAGNRPADVMQKWISILSVATEANMESKTIHADALKALEHCQNPDHAYGVCNH